MDLNKDFKLQMQNLLNDEEFNSFLQSFNLPSKKALRINSNYLSENKFLELCNFKTLKIKGLKDAFYLEDEVKIGNHPLHHAGLFYMQEPSAMMPVLCAPDIRGKVVLDLCATPGGKTGQLASLAGNDGFVIANEVNFSRANILRSNIERLGYKNVAISSLNVDYLSKKLKNMCFLTLVDAPCSGEGMFRKDPETIKEWSIKNVQSCALRQNEILQNAGDTVAKGGYLIYSTCTYNIEENEKVLISFLKNHPEFEIVKTNKKISDITNDGILIDKSFNTSFARRSYPHLGVGEGQFFALLKRSGDFEEPHYGKFNFNKLSLMEENLTNAFFKEVGFDEKITLQKIGNYIFVMPNKEINLSIPLLTMGVCVGSVDKNRFIPHHNFFKAFYESIKNKIDFNLTDFTVSSFLKGEQLSGISKSGYCLVTVDNFPLGFGKASSGKLNNLYPKGLRNK